MRKKKIRNIEIKAPKFLESVFQMKVSIILVVVVSILSVYGKIAPYDTIIGYASTNVASYSNGNDSHTPEETDYLYKVYIGIKWQCVEFARRWLFLRKGCVFHQIVGAVDIWSQVDNAQRVVDRKCFNFKKFPNGSPQPPINETLIIFGRSSLSPLYGHVAVIVDILPNFIRIAEQNYDDYYWTGNYSRQLPYVFRNGGYYIEGNMPVLGWMLLDDHNQTKPLDQQTIDQIIKLNGTSPDFICRNNTIE